MQTHNEYSHSPTLNTEVETQQKSSSEQKRKKRLQDNDLLSFTARVDSFSFLRILLQETVQQTVARKIPVDERQLVAPVWKLPVVAVCCTQDWKTQHNKQRREETS
jgi:hypothetical protein